tara:strand:- start:4388 stop:4990 length:603 start_codon:yes stop_codon:yes gene_type:complete
MVIFDLDGVLVDACEWHRRALNEALYDECSYKISIDDHKSNFNGLPTKVKLDKLISMGLISEDKKQAIYDLKQEKTIEIIKNSAKIREEKISLIKYLKERHIIVACFTNSIRETAELMLESTGILKLFDKVVTNQDVLKCKPDPEGYTFLLHHFSVSESETIIVEDSPKGIAAAEASGCLVVKVESPDDVDIDLLRSYIK